MTQGRWMQFEVRSFVSDQAVHVVLRGKKQNEQRGNTPYERVRSLRTLCLHLCILLYRLTGMLLFCH